jgi:hypothetical protein
MDYRMQCLLEQRIFTFMQYSIIWKKVVGHVDKVTIR